MFVFLTIVWDDGPGHGGGVDAADHPEHAEPAQMLPSLLLSQELRVIGKHNGDGATNAKEQKEKRERIKRRTSKGIHMEEKQVVEEIRQRRRNKESSEREDMSKINYVMV